MLKQNSKKKTWAYLYHFGLDNGFLLIIPKTQAAKEKISKLDFIEIKNISTSKETIKKMKRKPREWEEY